MDARFFRSIVLLGCACSLGANSPNFTVSAPTQEMAQAAARAAEHYRDALAMEWLGHKLPRWYQPCRLTVRVGQIGAGGWTKFQFEKGEVFGWRMMVQGTGDRIIDSVIPHEVSHTIFACHFRRPLPRWADEGAATLAEDELEQRRQLDLLEHTLRTRKAIPLRRLLVMTEYPKDAQQVYRLYAQGFSLVHFLVQQGGRKRFLRFMETAHRFNWDRAIEVHYQHKSVELLERRWHAWVYAGSPRLDPPADALADFSDGALKPLEQVKLEAEQRGRGINSKASSGVTLKAMDELETPTSFASSPTKTAKGEQHIPFASSNRSARSFDDAARVLQSQGLRPVGSGRLKQRRD